MTTLAAPTFTRQPATWQAYGVPALAVLGAPMLLIEFIHDGLQSAQPDQFGGLVSLFYIVGWMASIGGLMRLQATGHGSIGRTILGVQLVGLLLAFAWALIVATNPGADQASPIYQVTDLAWPLSHVFMLVVGIATLISRRLPGWQRATPLLCGACFPASIIAGLLAGERAGALVFTVGGAAAFLLLSSVARRGWQRPARAAA